jgi:hypothetical protein
MNYIRIGRFEIYKIDGWHPYFKGFCGCRFFHGFGIGITLLSDECRNSRTEEDL